MTDFKEMFERNCPNCSKIIYHKSKYSRNSSAKKKCLCLDCCTQIHNPKNKDIFRNCPKCNCLLTYKQKFFKDKAEKENMLCKKCAYTKSRETITRKSIERIKSIDLTRTCEDCGIKTTYKNYNSYRIAYSKYCNKCSIKNSTRNSYCVSKLELGVLGDLEKLGFIHSSFRDNNYYVGSRIPDYLNIDRKIIIEIFGDYWHCNPKIDEYANENFMHPKIKLTSKEIWENDGAKIQEYKLLGYKTIIIWESMLGDEGFSISNYLQHLVPIDTCENT